MPLLTMGTNGLAYADALTCLSAQTNPAAQQRPWTARKLTLRILAFFLPSPGLLLMPSLLYPAAGPAAQPRPTNHNVTYIA